MAPKKGTVNNPGGRPAGSPNKVSEEIRKALLQLLKDNMKGLKDDLKALESKDRVNVLISLARHLTPPALNPEKLTEDQLKQCYEYFKEQYEQNRI